MRLKFLGQATSEAAGMDVLYVGVEPLLARAEGYSESRWVTDEILAVKLKVVYESPWPKGNRGLMLALLKWR